MQLAGSETHPGSTTATEITRRVRSSSCANVEEEEDAINPRGTERYAVEHLFITHGDCAQSNVCNQTPGSMNNQQVSPDASRTSRASRVTGLSKNHKIDANSNSHRWGPSAPRLDSLQTKNLCIDKQLQYYLFSPVIFDHSESIPELPSWGNFSLGFVIITWAFFKDQEFRKIFRGRKI